MIYSNLNSTQIAAFPVVNRDAKHSGDIYARHTSEEMLSGMVNKLIDSDGFVITPQTEFGMDNEFTFNVHGYYFRIKSLKNLLDTFSDIVYGDQIYAEIALKNFGAWGRWVEIDGQDETSDVEVTDDSEFYYTGVKFVLVKYYESYAPSRTDVITFATPLLKFVGNNSENNWSNGWYVPENNYIKFNKSSYVIEKIDGGDLDALE